MLITSGGQRVNFVREIQCHWLESEIVAVFYEICPLTHPGSIDQNFMNETQPQFDFSNL